MPISRHAALILAVLALTGPAAGEDRIDLDNAERADGSSVVKLGLRLPSAWNPRIGLDMGVAAARYREGDLANRLLRSIDEGDFFDPAPEYSRPASAVWGSVTMPEDGRFFGFETANVNVRLDPENEDARVGAAMGRRWTFREALTATVRNEYSLVHRGLGLSNMVSSDVLRANRSLRLHAIDLRTTLFIRERWTSADPEWRRTVGAEHHLSGGLTVSGTIEDVDTADPGYSLRAGWKRRW